MVAANTIWQASPERMARSQMAAFLSFAQQKSYEKTGRTLASWQDLYSWSITELSEFWGCLAEFCQIKWQQAPTSVYENPRHSLRTAQWFPDGLVNVAENLLPPPSERVVLTCIYENKSIHEYTASALRDQVQRLRNALVQRGLKKGDYIAGVLCNGAEAIIAMLAAAAVGAVWCGVSPDFGVAAITDRLQQVHPKMLLFSQGYYYNGAYFSCVEKMQSCLAKLSPECLGIIVPYPGRDEERISGWECYAQLLKDGSQQAGSKAEPLFAPLPFSHPLYVLFTSGTTGKPKGIIHGAGGTLLQHKKELMLHADIGPSDRFLFYTTCSWMMWHWMVSSLSTGCSLVTYDGSPAYPGPRFFWQLIADQRLSVVGTSPKFISACMKAGISPHSRGDFSALRTILSTGAPLMPAHYEWIYGEVKSDLHLASISGGTDIISCFMLGNPLLPVYPGEIQGPGLGMAIAARHSDSPKRLIGEKGELICTKPFVSMPIAMLGDRDGSLYKSTYFDYFSDEEVWRHGDFIEITPRGGVIVYGRSDAVLNPAGVRIGTAEIYGQLEAIAEVEDALAVSYPVQDDTIIVLFVKLQQGLKLDAPLQGRIKKVIKEGLSPRHVPRKILQVEHIPYTRNGKKMEKAVSLAISGQPIDNLSAMEDKIQLEEYYRLAEHLA